MDTATFLPRSFVASALMAAAAAAPAAGRGGVTYPYALGPGTQYAEGCGVPGQNSQCACPVVFTDRVEGTFSLSLMPPGGDPYEVFALEAIDWTAVLGPTVHFSGSGLYRRGDEAGQPVHRLTLDLLMDGVEPISFDSGLVPGGGDEFPPIIEITIDDDALCYGHGFTVVAAPAGNPADVAPPGGDGVVNILDLLAVLADWGLEGPIATDIDGSGEVGMGDLLAVLAAWSG